MRQKRTTTQRAKSLRRTQTKAEGILWSLLRSKQLCGLKFRRQHPIGPYFADFACESHQLVIELDGDYHDQIQDLDLQRQRELNKRGWTVIRFNNDDVLTDAEAVVRAIASEVGLEYSFVKRDPAPSGILGEGAPNRS